MSSDARRRLDQLQVELAIRARQQRALRQDAEVLATRQRREAEQLRDRNRSSRRCARPNTSARRRTSACRRAPADARSARRQRDEVDVVDREVLVAVDEVDEAVADAVDARDVELHRRCARRHRPCAEVQRAAECGIGVAHAQRDRRQRRARAGRRHAGQRLRMRVDDDVHRPLPVERHFARAMARDRHESHRLQHVAPSACGCDVAYSTNSMPSSPSGLLGSGFCSETDMDSFRAMGQPRGSSMVQRRLNTGQGAQRDVRRSAILCVSVRDVLPQRTWLYCSTPIVQAQSISTGTPLIGMIGKQHVARLATLVVAVSCAACTPTSGPREPSLVTPPSQTGQAPVARVPLPAPVDVPPSAPRAASNTPSAPTSQTPLAVPAGALYVCVVENARPPKQAAIEFAPKVAELCQRHPEMGPCQYERNLCRRGGGRVFAADGSEITMATEAEYDRKVLRVRMRSN